MAKKVLKSLEDCVFEASDTLKSFEMDADFTVKVEGEKWHCYTAAIAPNEFFLYCDKGHATFVVDHYGNRAVCELIDWETDEDERLSKLNKKAKKSNRETIEERTERARRFIGMKKNPVFSINTDKVAQEMIRRGFTKRKIEKGDLEGWSDTLLDILESEYAIESEVSKYIRNS